MSVHQITDEADESEELRTERRRMWCVQQSMSVALTMYAHNPQAPTIDIMQAAEEMSEFIETGAARTAKVSRAKQ